MKYGVGIDVSKGKSTISMLSIAGEVIEEPFEINHDLNGLSILKGKLEKFSKNDIKIVLEQTGCKSQYKNVGKVENKNVGFM